MMNDKQQTEEVFKPYLVEVRNLIITALKEDAGLDGSQIAFIMNINKGTVSRILRRGATVSIVVKKYVSFLKEIRVHNKKINKETKKQ
jgi:predicted transcriptional regulator